MGWQDLNLTWHYVEKWAEAKPEAEALVSGEEHLSWGAFKEKMDRIARAYLAIGVEKGDRVALLSAARNEFLLSYMAAGKVGAMWLGLNPKFTLDELRYQVQAGRPDRRAHLPRQRSGRNDHGPEGGIPLHQAGPRHRRSGGRDGEFPGLH